MTLDDAAVTVMPSESPLPSREAYASSLTPRFGRMNEATRSSGAGSLRFAWRPPLRALSVSVAMRPRDLDLGQMSLAVIHEPLHGLDRGDAVTVVGGGGGVGADGVTVLPGLLDHGPDRRLDVGCGDAGLLGQAVGVLLFDREEDLVSFDLVAPLVEGEDDGLLQSVVDAPEPLDPLDGLRSFPKPATRHPNH